MLTNPLIPTLLFSIPAVAVLTAGVPSNVHTPATYNITHNFNLQSLGDNLLPQANKPKGDFSMGALHRYCSRCHMDRGKGMPAGKGSDEAEPGKVGQGV